jgi:predicted transposase YdaD
MTEIKMFDLSQLSHHDKIINLVAAILILKFPKLTRQEIEVMFTLDDLKQTRVYLDAKQEGERQKAESLVLRQLNRRLGKLDSHFSKAVEKLEIAQLDDLAEALLDFTDVTDLERWLEKAK